MKGKILGIISIFFIISVICLSAGAIAIDGDLNQSINGHLTRAITATTAGNVAAHIDLALDGLEEWNLSEGNWGWIFDNNPDTEMSFAVTQFKELRDRCLEIEENYNASDVMSSFDYSKSLTEVKGFISEVNFSPYSLYTKTHASYLYPEIYFLCIVIGFVGIAIATILIYW